ncbi:MAG: insulinase family protein [Leptospiraceae bacterium]|nr:insulinase family protein [Leptospiraceae bacterium]
MEDTVYKYRLDNGLVVLYQKVPYAVSLSIGLWLKFGSRHEAETEKGCTHFVEHMLFKGTKNRTAKQQAMDIERVGGIANAETSREYTNFYVTLAKPEIDIGMDFLSDLIFYPLFLESEIQKETNVILEEFNGYEDSPEDYVYDLYYQNIFYKSPLGFDILGSKDSIQSINQSKIKNFYQSMFTTDRMMLSLSGNIEISDMEKLVNHYFGREKRISNQTLQIDKAEKAFTTNFFKRKLEQIIFLLGAEGIPRQFQKSVVLYLMTNILGGGMSSRLFQKIREDLGLCYSISCFPSLYTNAGMVSISCATSKDRFFECLDAILKEIRDLKKNGFTEEELQHSKTNQKGIMATGFELPEARMVSIAIQEMYYSKYYSFQDRMDTIDQVTLYDLNLMKDLVFGVKKLHFTGIGNLTKKEILQINTEI